MARRPKLTRDVIDETILLKADDIFNGDIVCVLGIHESMFYRWIREPKNKLQRELSEGLKKRGRRSSGRCSRRSARRRSRATGTGLSSHGCLSASTLTISARPSPSATTRRRTPRWVSTRGSARISPMELTYLPTGQRIIFRGADDPLTLEGVKFVRGYAAVVGFEELDQFDGIDAGTIFGSSARTTLPARYGAG